MRSIIVLGTVVLVGLAGPVLAAPKAHKSSFDVRQVLPATLEPSHYDLKIVPDAEHLAFRGTVDVAGAAAKPGKQIVLNAKGLTLDDVKLDGRKAASVSLDDKLGRATITFAQPYAAGRHSLSIVYHGPISKGTLGFFAMDYDSPAGKRRTLATNFEPAEARRLLPCWDEPAKKATFTVTVDAPADRMAISNMPMAATTPLAGGLQRVRFAETPKMSTYLLFLGVGDYERIHQQVDGVDVGVVFKRGDGAKAAYGLSQAVAILHYYNDYFGVRFPLPKLDLVAAPGEISGGSMENWGAIFYSQDHLLFDPATSTESDRQLVFLVVSHEMAHQWFGDLVTMAWWDNLWLNEGFARWMQTHAADGLHPEWKTGLQAAATIFEAGKGSDAQASTHPVLQPIGSAEQAAEAFDNITYDKGAAVITMLEAYVGSDAFREGVRRYMKAHIYGNTVDSDLWSQVQAVAGKPVLAIEHDFTRQAGVPLVRVEAVGSGVHLSEGRFAEDPDSLKGAKPTAWKIPLTVASSGQPDTHLLLSGTATAPGRAALVNAGGLAYARIAYSQGHAAALANRMGEFAPMDQINLMNDASALGESGYAPAGNLMDFMSRLPPDADPVVGARAVSLMNGIDGSYRGLPGRAAFRREALKLLTPIAGRLGAQPKPGEDGNVTTLRASVWSAQARFGDSAALARARSVYASGQGSAAEQRAALNIVAESADPPTFDALLAKARATKDPQEKARLMRALAGVADPALSARAVEIALTPDAPAGSAPQLIAIATARNPDVVWGVLKPHMGKGGLPMDEQDAWRIVSAVAGRSADPARIADIRAYGEAVIPLDARRPVESAVGSIKLNQRIRAKAIPEIDRWLASHAG
jgi:aminopeptidase N